MGNGLIRYSIGIFLWLMAAFACAQPLLFPVCLSPESIAQGSYSSPYLLIAVTHQADPVKSVYPNSTSSAQFALLNYAAYGLPMSALKVAYRAYTHARALGYDPQQILTVVDYTQPSDRDRFWVLDVAHERVLYHTLVSHGTQSGGRYATNFSNDMDSHQSSLGVLLTQNDYAGMLGYSLRLQGLEPRFNGNAYARDIVVHSANYVNRSIARRFHEVGESFGCLAISSTIAPRVINTIKSGTIIVNYYPNRDWLEHSEFLH